MNLGPDFNTDAQGLCQYSSFMASAVQLSDSILRTADLFEKLICLPVITNVCFLDKKQMKIFGELE